MTIHNTSTSNSKVVYLDLSIEIVNNKFSYKSYDKIRDFNFPITNFPHLHGNIPINPAYGVVTSQLVRYCRINLNLDSFISDCKQLFTKLLSQAFSKNKLINTYQKFCKTYLHLWAHFGKDMKEDAIIGIFFS